MAVGRGVVGDGGLVAVRRGVVGDGGLVAVGRGVVGDGGLVAVGVRPAMADRWRCDGAWAAMAVGRGGRRAAATAAQR